MIFFEAVFRSCVYSETGDEKVEVQAALWYNKCSTVKASDNPVGLTENNKSPFVKMGNHSLKGVFA